MLCSLPKIFAWVCGPRLNQPAREQQNVLRSDEATTGMIWAPIRRCMRFRAMTKRSLVYSSLGGGACDSIGLYISEEETLYYVD